MASSHAMSVMGRPTSPAMSRKIRLTLAVKRRTRSPASRKSVAAWVPSSRFFRVRLLTVDRSSTRTEPLVEEQAARVHGLHLLLRSRELLVGRLELLVGGLQLAARYPVGSASPVTVNSRDPPPPVRSPLRRPPVQATGTDGHLDRRQGHRGVLEHDEGQAPEGPRVVDRVHREVDGAGRVVRIPPFAAAHAPPSCARSSNASDSCVRCPPSPWPRIPVRLPRSGSRPIEDDVAFDVREHRGPLEEQPLRRAAAGWARTPPLRREGAPAPPGEAGSPGRAPCPVDEEPRAADRPARGRGAARRGR